MTKVELEALLEIEKIDDEVARTTIRNWFIHDANFRTGYLNCGAMMRNAADCEKERQRRQEAEAQRDKARSALDKARKLNKANSKGRSAAEAVRDDCRQQLETERAKRKALETEVNRLKAQLFDLMEAQQGRTA
jgi:hypothetical protein